MDLMLVLAVVALAVLCVGVVYVVKLALGSGQTQPQLGVPPAPPRPPVLSVQIPPLAWEPMLALAFMNALLPLTTSGPLTLRIVATSTRITWAVVLAPQAVAAVTRTILAFYPQAEIVTQADTETTELPSITEWRGRLEYFAPLRPVGEQRALDPLTSMVGAMAHLVEGEQVGYFVTLQKPEQDYQRAGRQKIRHSRTPELVMLGLNVANVAVGNRPVKVTPRRSLDKYEARLQRVFEEKLDNFLVPVTVRLQIHTQDAQRFASLRDSILSATSIFEHPQGNSFIPHPQGYPLILTAQEIASLWHLPSTDIQTPGVVRSHGAKAPLPLELVQQTSGILVGYNVYQGKRLPVYVAEADRITHMNITGKTRVGKTTFMHNLIHQDIAQGQGVAVIDPHGDLIHQLLACSIPPGREKDVVLFDLADVAHPIALNLLYVPPGVPRHAAVGLTLGVLKKIFAEQWSATRMEDALYSALAVLVENDGTTIRDIAKLFSDAAYRAKLLARTTDSVALEYWHDDYERMSERNQLEVARPILHRIRAFYRNPVIEQIVAQPSSLDFRAMMDEGKIFLASLAGEATQAEASIMGALLISKLQLAAMSRTQLPVDRRRMFYLYVDEVQNFVTTSLSTMFSEAAKYALSLTVANQYLSQLAGDTLEAVLGNTGTTVMFACGNQDAQALGAYVKPVFDRQTLMNLDRFQTLVKLQHGGKTLPAFSMQTLPPPELPDDAAERIRRIRGQGQQGQTIVVEAEQAADRANSIDDPSSVTTTAQDDTVPDLDI